MNNLHSIPRQSSLACFLSARIEALASEKSEAQIASDLGYSDPRVLHMIVQGEARLQLDQVLPLANAIGVDVGWLLRMTAACYSPRLIELVDALLSSTSPITKNELAILQVIRSTSHYRDPELNDDLERQIRGIFREADPCSATTIEG